MEISQPVDFDMADVMQELILHADEATESVLVNSRSSPKGNKHTLRENWMITVLIHKCHCFRELDSVGLCFLSVFYPELDCKSIHKLCVVSLGVDLSDMFGEYQDGVSSCMMSKIEDLISSRKVNQNGS
jgi:hypothetical protein